jgi:hypothetical protein
MVETVDILREDQDYVRGEVRSLKQSQVLYFQISITATGVILGVGGSLDPEHPRLLLFLAPLIVILPSWLIFFDKAVTITRAVGFLRVIEGLIQGRGPAGWAYAGWENGLSTFRIMQQSGAETHMVRRVLGILKRSLKGSAQGFPLLFRYEAGYRDWILHWITFFGLSVLCLVVGFRFIYHAFVSAFGSNLGQNLFAFFGAHKWEYFAAIALSATLFIACTLHTLYILKDLINGKYSYEQQSVLWEKALGLHQSEANGRR